MRNKNWFGIALLVSSVAFADYRYLPDSPGTWKPWEFTADADPRRDLGATPADVKQVEAQLLKLNEILRKTNGITNPIGFSVETAGLLDYEPKLPDDGAGVPVPTARPFPYSLSFGAFPVILYGSGATAKRDDTGETALVIFFVNTLSTALNMETSSIVPEFDKIDGDVVRMGPPKPDVMGFERYGEALVLKKSPEPIWAAVTMSETLDLVARGIERRLVEERNALARVQKSYDDKKDPKKREQRLAEHRKIAAMQKDPAAFMAMMTKAEDQIAKQADTMLPEIATVKAMVTKSEQELAGARAMAAGLSAADKAAPACYSIDKVSLARFRRAPATGCDPLVRPNWKLFNPKLPRTAPQVLVIGHFSRCLGPEKNFSHVGGCVANKRLIESVDKAALLAWLQ